MKDWLLLVAEFVVCVLVWVGIMCGAHYVLVHMPGQVHSDPGAGGAGSEGTW